MFVGIAEPVISMCYMKDDTVSANHVYNFKLFQILREHQKPNAEAICKKYANLADY